MFRIRTFLATEQKSRRRARRLLAVLRGMANTGAILSDAIFGGIVPTATLPIARDAEMRRDRQAEGGPPATPRDRASMGRR